MWQQVPRGHQYSVGQVLLLVSLVLSACAAFRCAGRIFEILDDCLPVSLGRPHWSTGRLWLLRLGHYKLTRPKEQADDWVWMIDHTNQIGVEKCLIVLGIRLCDLPEAGHCLRHEDMELIDLIPTVRANKEIVFGQLQAAVEKTGVPRVILDDHGAELSGAVKLFRQQHPQTDEIYDIKHKAACLLKRRLEKDATWKDFCRKVGQTKFQVQQTELAFLVPPSQRSKARFMNLKPLVRWARQTLEVLDRQPPEVLRYVTTERLDEKLGWLRAFREPLGAWSEFVAVIETAQHHVRTQGLSQQTPQRLGPLLEASATTPHSRMLRDELLAFVTAESSKARNGERLPGTTEVLESCIGKLKSLERDQHKSGLTGLLLGLGAVVSKTTADVVQRALESSSTKSVWQWCRNNLGETVQTKRKYAYKTANT